MDASNLKEVLRCLTMSEIIQSASHVRFGRADRRSRNHLLDTVAQLPLEDQEQVALAAGRKRKAPMATETRDSKRSRLSLVQRPPNGNAIEAASNQTECELEEDGDGSDSEPEEGGFMKAPAQIVVDQCISDFIDRTSNQALEKAICIACARELWQVQTQFIYLAKIPNHYHLYPFEIHPAHILTDGMLLYEEALQAGPDGRGGQICNDCIRDLKGNKRPKFSLANGMWVGPIPQELAVLTLPERVLVARYFPAAHIVKLFPKQKGAKQWSTSGLNSGIRGNVSTYRLNTDDIAEMIDPVRMPPSSSILASTIGVSIVGPQNMPEKSMPGFLRVRRDHLRTALVWLKDNNPLYADIVVSEDTLAQYPEDGIPREILGTVRYSDDVNALEQERAGYVVEDDDEETELGVEGE